MVTFLKPLSISLKHMEISQEVVCQKYWLGPLQMCIAWDYHSLIGLGSGNESCLEGLELFLGIPYGLLAVKAYIGSHLIVAGASSVELARNVAYLLEEAGLDVHVKVFQVLPPGKGAFFDLLPDGTKARADAFCLFVCDDALFGQHTDMGNGPCNILAVKAPIVGNRCCVALDGRFLH